MRVLSQLASGRGMTQMSIDDGIRMALEGLRRVEDGCDEILRSLETARQTHGILETPMADLQLSVARLEAAILALRALREQLDGPER